MTFDLFSDPWATALGCALAESADYRRAAARWEGGLVLSWLGDDGAPRGGVFLDLLHGDCRAARAAREEDLASADFVIAGGLPAWLAVLEGRSEPLGAIMRGQLRLRRGSLARLMPFVEAARLLAMAARTVPTRFPETAA